MHETPAASARPAEPDEPEALDLGNGARWFFQSKYRLMADLAQELLPKALDAETQHLRDRLDRMLKHALAVQRARMVITVLLASGLFAATISGIAASVSTDATGTDVGGGVALLERVAAWAASVTVILIVLRLGFDRYLDRVDVAATLIVVRIAQHARQ